MDLLCCSHQSLDSLVLFISIVSHLVGVKGYHTYALQYDLLSLYSAFTFLQQRMGSLIFALDVLQLQQYFYRYASGRNG